MKTLLITLLLLSPFAYADMDRVCTIVLNWEGDENAVVLKQLQEKKCERDNVLEVYGMKGATKYEKTQRATLLVISNTFCRFDRNRDIESYLAERSVLSCILYSTKGRRGS